MNTQELFQTAIDTVERVEKCATHPINPRILHAVMGLCDEAGELIKRAKDQMHYGKEYTYNEVIEEMGDFFYFFTLAVLGLAEDEVGKTPLQVFREIVLGNEAKLNVRYPKGHYDDDNAVNRDIIAEYQAISKVTERK